MDSCLEREPQVCVVVIGQWGAVHSTWHSPGSGGSEATSPATDGPTGSLFSQVIGRKCIRLNSPQESDASYPHSTHLLHNTGQVGRRDLVWPHGFPPTPPVSVWSLDR